jgi:hypothetical protein
MGARLAADERDLRWREALGYLNAAAIAALVSVYFMGLRHDKHAREVRREM